jgi:hypothetical protein
MPGFPLKKPSGLKWNPTEINKRKFQSCMGKQCAWIWEIQYVPCSTFMHGKSSGRGTCATPKQCHSTTSAVAKEKRQSLPSRNGRFSYSDQTVTKHSGALIVVVRLHSIHPASNGLCLDLGKPLHVPVPVSPPRDRSSFVHAGSPWNGAPCGVNSPAGNRSSSACGVTHRCFVANAP